MNNCIFCKIVKNELDAYLVYEDANFMAFLDITPKTIGHTLIIPKTHCRWVHQVDKFDQYWLIARKIAQAQIKSLHCDYVNFVTMGLLVEHAHIHVIPRKFDDGLGGVPQHSLREDVSSSRQKQTAQLISQALEKE